MKRLVSGILAALLGGNGFQRLQHHFSRQFGQQCRRRHISSAEASGGDAQTPITINSGLPLPVLTANTPGISPSVLTSRTTASPWSSTPWAPIS